MDNDRKLSKKEEIRLENFNLIEQELKEQGYKEKEITLSWVVVNVVGIFSVFPIIFLCRFSYLMFHSNVPMFEYSFIQWLGILLLFFLLICLHELIHGLFWSLFTKDHWNNIEFGFILKSFTPYCTCQSYLGKWEYIIGCFMPTFLLGIIPTILSIILGNNFLNEMAMLMIIGGIGDLMIMCKLLCFRPIEKHSIKYIDHPTKCGVVVFHK